MFLREVPGRGYAIRRAPFSPIPHYAAGGSRIYVAEGVSYAVRVLDSHGAPLGTVGDPARRVEITDDIRSDFLQDTLRFWPSGERPRIEEEFRLMLVHEYLPLVADMHVDDLGHVWLRDATREDEVWDVFSPDGSLAAHIELPPHRALLDVSNDVLVILQRGQYGEDIVSAYRYSRHP